eukprot:CAMPEP_0179240230 /NCGR_PEP_ID=MMETSP0797-20121207/15868_1 /TAXON_ID=47934 /ORGANISM="Dinophysis acuminata, Strain DAEP01" /LENGTH=85 /DNA_ID=CAMNT_0020947575 /DNA_START=14 /DNA_END=270 /DNA_ORIENTATION=-
MSMVMRFRFLHHEESPPARERRKQKLSSAATAQGRRIQPVERRAASPAAHHACGKSTAHAMWLRKQWWEATAAYRARSPPRRSLS